MSKGYPQKIRLSKVDTQDLLKSREVIAHYALNPRLSYKQSHFWLQYRPAARLLSTADGAI